jgi:2-phosphosulfolactate phosphatase
VNAEATVQAILRAAPAIVTLVAMGREGKARADEDELCALYLRSRLEGRTPDTAALRTLLATMAPPANPRLLASGDFDSTDRDIATHVDLVAVPVVVRSEAGLLIATAEARADGSR